MDRTMNEFERAKSRMAGDFRAMIADSEDLLNATAAVTGDSFAAARAKFEKNVARARTALTDASQPIIEHSRETAAAADKLLRGNAWTAVGVAIAAGILIGLLTAKR
jgi:ElaB/YqjD/DUF883 family membrane-anchored ribosome-binding protein